MSTSARSLLSILCILLACALPQLPTPVRADGLPSPKQVLILNSYHQGYRGSDNFLEGFRSTLSRTLPGTEVYIEYLDSLHYSGKDFDHRVLDTLRFKYKNRHFDLIFSTDDYAFDLLEKHRDEIFGATPVVFCGTNSFDSSRLIGKHGFNGIDERPSFADTLSLIFELHPQTREIVVIHDTTVTGLHNSAEFRSQSARFSGRVHFSYLAGLKFEELIDRMRRLQPGTVVFYFANNVENRNGERLAPGEVAKQLAAVGQVPIYTGWEFMLGNGIVGGRLLNLREHGTVSAQMAIRILQGARPDSMPQFSPSPNQYMFDYNQLSRFEIRESQLPKGSIVINRPPGFFRAYKVALLSAICIALVLTVVGILIKLLKSRKELSNSLLQLRAAQSELVGTARKAGMAEVATNVLHNVGNVLNSVNVSAGILRHSVTKSKVGNLTLAAKLLKEHNDDLAGYLTSDEQGRLLPVYLEKLAEALESERRQISDEVTQLTMRIDHVKEIVATQQSYAGSANLVEPVRIEELLDHALAINAEGLRGVTVVREFGELPLMPLDKGRVLQILVNLVSNAKHATSTMEGSREITLTAELTDNNLLRLSVTDNGVGISRENMTRIFSHAFTTRKGGHGFGLHSSALAAKEMGGTLTATSPGEGQGATFCLEFPVTCEL